MSNDLLKITCGFATENALYLAYMPFIKGGGLFIRTNHVLELGTQAQLVVNLLNETEAYEVEAKVIWITPQGAQSSKPSGLGMQFTEAKGRILVDKIETYLAGMLKSTQMTDTM